MNKVWPYLIIIILVAAIYFMYKQLEMMKDEQDRLLHNMEMRMLDNQSQVLELTKKEFRKYNRDTLLKQLIDSLEIKTRNIVSTINHKYHYTYDTTVYMVIDTLRPGRKHFGIKFNECIGAYGFVEDSTITFDSIPVNYNASTIYYWKRPHQFWFVKYGKKQYFADTKNNCTGESKVEQINISK